ncbi:MAG: septation regulator SpoVG [Candidatus Sumerlaeia bacterium]|nr:septation regulator SpoVG [Candidatus Sumerlaeia bacterium]
MEITECRVRPCVKEDEKLKAFATIVLNHCFVVTDLKVIAGPKGLFVAMPSRRRKDGKFRDIAHPLTREFRAKIEEIVLHHYHQEMKRLGEQPPSDYNDYEETLADFQEP